MAVGVHLVSSVRDHGAFGVAVEPIKVHQVRRVRPSGCIWCGSDHTNRTLIAHAATPTAP